MLATGQLRVDRVARRSLLHSHGRLADGIPDRDRDSVFAGWRVLCLGRTSAGDRDAIADRPTILVVGRRLVRLVPNDDGPLMQPEGERFPLGTVERTIRRVKLVKWMIRGHR